MKYTVPVLTAVGLLTVACGGGVELARVSTETYAAYRAQQTTTFENLDVDTSPPPRPPEGVLELIQYPAPLGDNYAYISPLNPDEPKPAMLWVTGGVDWGIGEEFWIPGPPDNNQSADAFRDAGLILMVPSLRGSNGNPGHNECLLGEVDDILAAMEYLKSLQGVDADRIYLGGHSTGGSLVLLTAALSPDFRAVFSFGPSAGSHGGQCMDRYEVSWETLVRQPIHFVDDIRSPTWIIEGANRSNAEDVPLFLSSRRSAPVKGLVIKDASHFSVLGPASRVIAQQLVADTAPEVSISLTEAQISQQVALDTQ